MNSIIQQPLVLASQSPRRKELLEQMGLALEILPADVDETHPPGQGPDVFVRELSRKKAAAVMALRPRSWVIGADTVVVVDGEILGKPDGRKDAERMISRLSGRCHSVFTGYTVGHQTVEQIVTAAVETRVWFKPLSDAEIRWYTATAEPYDKAGAYGIQGLGACLVKEIRGSYANVVGLPVCEVMETLQSLQVIHLKETQS